MKRVDVNGWSPYPYVQAHDIKGLELEFTDDCMFLRPKLISGIDNNNGWIRTDERLPENDDVVTVFEDNSQYDAWYNKDGKYWECPYEGAYSTNPSHWRPKEKYPKPIY